MRGGLRLLSVIPFIVLIGCEEGARGEAAAPAVAASDSASPHIVASRHPLHPDGIPWAISSDPVLILGEREEAHEPLHRVLGAHRLSDGRILVASGSQLLYFSAEGALLQRVGGPGEGPGEVGAPTYFVPMGGDSVYLWDDRLGPAQVFRGDGSFAATHRMTPDSFDRLRGAVAPLCRATFPFPLPDLSFLQLATPCGPEWERGIPEREVHSPDVHVFRSDLAGEVTLLAGTFQAEPRMWMRVDDDPVSTVVGGAASVPPSAGAIVGGSPSSDIAIAVGVDPPRLFVGDGREYEIREYAADGSVGKVFRRLDPPIPFSAQDHAAWLEPALRQPEPLRGGPLLPAIAARHAARIEVLTRMPPPPHHRRFERLLLDAEGHVWAISRRGGIHVFNAEGQWMGEVLLPATLGIDAAMILEIGLDYILAKTWDDLWVERIVLHSLKRGGSGVPASASR